MFRSLLFALLALAALTALPPQPSTARAGTAVRMDLDELVEAADLVLEARVTAESPVLGDNGLVYTDLQLEVERTFWGEDLPLRTIRVPGGALPGGRATMIPGLTHPGLGESALLMLSSPSLGGVRIPCGLSQGCYRILTPLSGTKVATREGSPEALIDPVTGQLSHGQHAQVLDYAELKARCLAACSAKQIRLGVQNGEGR